MAADIWRGCGMPPESKFKSRDLPGTMMADALLLAPAECILLRWLMIDFDE